MDPKVCIPILNAYSPKAGLLLGFILAAVFRVHAGAPCCPPCTLVHAKLGVRYQKLQTETQSRGVYNLREPPKRFVMDSSAHPEQSFLGPDLVF